MHIGEAMNSALSIMRRQQWDDALLVLHDILNVRQDDPWVLFLMGTCHRMKGNDGLAFTLYMRAMEVREDFFEAMLNTCAILRERGLHEQEVALLHDCRRIRPDDTMVLHNLSGAHLNVAKPLEAEKYAMEAIGKEGERPDTLIQLGLALLEQERFGEAWDALDKALLIGERKVRNFWTMGQTPMWDGTPGQTVVVYGEQGHGDEIMFASCLRETIARCKQVIIDTSKPDMAALYERSFPEAQLHRQHAELEIDAAIPFGSLPTLFRRSADDFPEHDGYISACPAKRREMRRRLDDLGDGLKIGVAWRGGIAKTHSCYRNTSLVQWSPILKQDGAHFVSVQYGPDVSGEADLQQDQTGVAVHHWQAAIDDFDMLTALIAELDLVISVPQTAVHQRAALGKECWVVNPHRSPWPFGLNRESMLWYPKQTRIFRQKEREHGKWAPVMVRVGRALAERTGGAVGPVIVPPAESQIEIGAVP